MRNLFQKYKEIILYIFFGGCTTFVNIAAYYVCAYILGMSVLTGTAAAWLVSVLFAYITNRQYVFNSGAKEFRKIIKEMTSFFGCRLLTCGIDMFLMYVCVEILSMNDMLMKILSNILVIVINYIVSKLFIFKKK